MSSKFDNTVDLKRVVVTSIIFGFLLIPLHELGHVICHWTSGNPASMSYAYDYLLSDGEKTFLGYLGGPLLPILISIVATFFVYLQKKISIFCPIAVIGCFDRLTLYVSGGIPSDERALANFLNWNESSFKYIFLTIEIVIILTVFIILFRMKIKIIKILLIFIISFICFLGMALFGIFVVEKNLFPEKFQHQFG